jgi:crotonobetainyl-CoA:carnitine CoA-transferase CaiB-like acyl-CoA transferase
MDSGKVEIDWLKGVRVVLIGHYVPAPMAAYFLRMLGAEVIKVEQDQGDYLRQVGLAENADRQSFSPMFRMLNAGFKSVGLQWKTPQGAEILKNILANTDILLDGGRMKSLEKALGMPPEQVSDRLIYIPITAYGQKGPMANLAGHDNNILALAGNLSYTQKNADGLPTVFSAPVADLFAGQMAAFGALAALIGQDRGNKGIRKIDASMLHAGFFLNLLELAARNDQGAEIPKPETAWMNGGRADYQSYRCKDGKVIFFGLLEAWALKRFLDAIERAEILIQTNDQQAFKESLRMLFLERNQAEWVELGRIHDACITPVNDLEAALEDPQIQALGLMQTVEDPDLGQLELPGFPLGFGESSLPPQLPNSAPRLGEHTREVLADLLGYKEEQIAGLQRKGIVSVE